MLLNDLKSYTCERGFCLYSMFARLTVGFTLSEHCKFCEKTNFFFCLGRNASCFSKECMQKGFHILWQML